MLLGITENLQESNRIAAKKRISVATIVFLISLLLPFILLALFHFKIVSSKPVFTSEIQEPVAKLINQDRVGTAFLVSPTKMLTARHIVENLAIGSNVSLIFEKAKSPISITAKVIYFSPNNSQAAVDGKVSMDYFLTQFGDYFCEVLSRFISLSGV